MLADDIAAQLNPGGADAVRAAAEEEFAARAGAGAGARGRGGARAGAPRTTRTTATTRSIGPPAPSASRRRRSSPARPARRATRRERAPTRATRCSRAAPPRARATPAPSGRTAGDPLAASAPPPALSARREPTAARRPRRRRSWRRRPATPAAAAGVRRPAPPRRRRAAASSAPPPAPPAPVESAAAAARRRTPAAGRATGRRAAAAGADAPAAPAAGPPAAGRAAGRGRRGARAAARRARRAEVRRPPPVEPPPRTSRRAGVAPPSGRREPPRAAGPDAARRRAAASRPRSAADARRRPVPRRAGRRRSRRRAADRRAPPVAAAAGVRTRRPAAAPVAPAEPRGAAARRVAAPPRRGRRSWTSGRSGRRPLSAGLRLPAERLRERRRGARRRQAPDPDRAARGRQDDAGDGGRAGRGAGRAARTARPCVTADAARATLLVEAAGRGPLGDRRRARPGRADAALGALSTFLAGIPVALAGTSEADARRGLADRRDLRTARAPAGRASCAASPSIEVAAPSTDEMHGALHQAADGDPTAARAAERLLPLAELAPLGAGVFLDAARHAAARNAAVPADEATLAREAFAAYVAPLHADLDEQRPSTTCSVSLRRSAEERAALERAKATLDQLDFYPKPVNIDHVRILHVPWLFTLPWFRRFHGYEMGPLILLKRPLAENSPEPDRARAVPRLAGPGPSPEDVVELRPRRLRRQPARGRGAARRRRRRELMDPSRSWRSRATARRSRPSAPSANAPARTASCCSSTAPTARPAMVECDATGAIEITEGDDVAVIPANEAIPGPARALPDIRPTPATAIRLDAITGELAAPLGTIDHLAEIVAGAREALRRPDRRHRGVRDARPASCRSRSPRARASASCSPPATPSTSCDPPRGTAATSRDLRELQLAAFAPSELEADIADALRAAGDHVPELCLVASDDDALVGHVMLSKAHVEAHPALGLGPIAVDPDPPARGHRRRADAAAIDARERDGLPADRPARPPRVLPALRLPAGRGDLRHHVEVRRAARGLDGAPAARVRAADPRPLPLRRRLRLTRPARGRNLTTSPWQTHLLAAS